MQNQSEHFGLPIRSHALLVSQGYRRFQNSVDYPLLHQLVQFMQEYPNFRCFHHLRFEKIERLRQTILVHLLKVQVLIVVHPHLVLIFDLTALFLRVLFEFRSPQI